VILAASDIRISCGTTDRQTDRQTHKRRWKAYSCDYRERGYK